MRATRVSPPAVSPGAHPAAIAAAFGHWMLLRAAPKQAHAAEAIARRFLWRAGAPEAVDGPAIAAFLAALAAGGASRHTLANQRSILSCLCRFLQERGMIRENPALAVRLARPENPPPRWLDDGEVRAVLLLAERRGFWPEAVLALCTGLRLGELIRLRWEDVDLPRRRLLVRRAKGRRPRTVDLSPAALVALADQRQALEAAGCRGFGQVFPAHRGGRGPVVYLDRPRGPKWWRRIGRELQAAVPKFAQGTGAGRAWHLFRHTFATRLAQAGVSDRRIARLLGHSDVRTVDVYAHLAAGYDPAVELAAPPGAMGRPGGPEARPPPDWQI